MSLKRVGIVSTIVGACVSGFGYYKFDEAKSMMKTLEDGYALFGGDFSSSMNSWSNWADKAAMYRIILIIGVVFFIAGIIMFVSGSSKEKNASNMQMGTGTTDKLKELDNLKANHLISEKEYEDKRKEILSKL